VVGTAFAAMLAIRAGARVFCRYGKFEPATLFLNRTCTEMEQE
jgi:hypothetical protein